MVIDVTKYDVRNGEDCMDLLSSLGFDKFDIETIAESLADYKAQSKCRRGAIEGLIGDDYYEVQERCESCLEDLRSEVENLQGPSRKGNTKADIARRVSSIIRNLSTYLNIAHVYEYSDL